ncbi:MAG: hypothetical protein ACR65Z_16235 [Methylocystis sp.]
MSDEAEAPYSWPSSANKTAPSASETTDNNDAGEEPSRGSLIGALIVFAIISVAAAYCGIPPGLT